MESRLSYFQKLKQLGQVPTYGWKAYKMAWSVSWKGHFSIPTRIWTLTFLVSQRTSRNCNGSRRRGNLESAGWTQKYLKPGLRNGQGKAHSFVHKSGSLRKSIQFSREQFSDCIRSLKIKTLNNWCTRSEIERRHQMTTAIAISLFNSTMTIMVMQLNSLSRLNLKKSSLKKKNVKSWRQLRRL